MSSFPDKEKRTKCWSSRDKYWSCLDNLPSAIRGTDEELLHCLDLRKLFQGSCSAIWVKHFDRKRQYSIFKEELQKTNYEPIDEKFN